MNLLAALPWVLVVLAADPSPSSPPADSQDRLPFEPFRMEPFEQAPAPPPEDRSQVAEEVAQDAYLGGSGVAGPLALMGTAVNLLVEPALGAWAAFMSKDAGPAGGDITRSTAGAYGKTLSYMGSFIAMWAVSIPVWALLIGIGPLAAGGILAATMGFSNRGIQSGAGLGLLLASMGLGTALLAAAGPWFLGRTVGLGVGDLVFSKLGEGKKEDARQAETQSELQKMLRTQPLGPFPSVRAGVLLAAVSGGVLERHMRWDGLPVVGPFITAAKVSADLPQHLTAARSLADMGPLPDGAATRARALLFIRSGLLAGAQALILTAVGVVGVGALGFLVAGLVPALGLALGAPLLLGALVAAALLAGVGVACGAASFLTNVMLPWTVAWMASGQST
jgi:hypothetical protein